MGAGALDVVVLVLAGPRFRRQHATAVDLLEIAKGKLVAPLPGPRLVIDAQVPAAIGLQPMGLYEAVLVRGAGLMLAPGVALIEHHFALPDQGLGVLEARRIQLDSHGSSKSVRRV